jgi:hypothetical protein
MSIMMTITHISGSRGLLAAVVYGGAEE